MSSIIRVKRISELHLLVSANVIPSSLILFILMMETIRFSETSVLARARLHHISEHGILHSPAVKMSDVTVIFAFPKVETIFHS
jgi:hypothetical protein